MKSDISMASRRGPIQTITIQNHFIGQEYINKNGNMPEGKMYISTAQNYTDVHANGSFDFDSSVNVVSQNTGARSSRCYSFADHTLFWF